MLFNNERVALVTILWALDVVTRPHFFYNERLALVTFFSAGNAIGPLCFFNNERGALVTFLAVAAFGELIAVARPLFFYNQRVALVLVGTR